MTNNQLTLEQAIQHAKERAVALSGPCAAQHEQLATWLHELQELRKAAIDSEPVVPDRSIFEQWWESQNGVPLDGWDSLRTTDGYCDDGIDGQFEAWNACRAAMIDGD